MTGVLETSSLSVLCPADHSDSCLRHWSRDETWLRLAWRGNRRSQYDRRTTTLIYKLLVSPSHYQFFTTLSFHWQYFWCPRVDDVSDKCCTSVLCSSTSPHFSGVHPSVISSASPSLSGRSTKESHLQVRDPDLSSSQTSAADTAQYPTDSQPWFYLRTRLLSQPHSSSTWSMSEEIFWFRNIASLL